MGTAGTAAGSGEGEATKTAAAPGPGRGPAATIAAKLGSLSACVGVALLAVMPALGLERVLLMLLGAVFGWAILGVAVCWALAHVLDAFTFGDDVASSLGIPVGAVRSLLLVLTALVTAALVSVTGAIGFVGLVLPHAARFLVGPGHGRLVPVSAVVGALFMVWVDAISRVAFSPTPLPVGVATALIGVPAFVALMFRSGARS